jgi:acetolactate synthase regulatory subunit
MTDHDIAELLPFYANGTLDAAESARVEAELATCATCASELRELNALAATLKARADAAPPLAEHVLDDVFARISTPATAIAATRLRTAWWGTPARYATAATLVIGFGAAAFAAHQAREANITASNPLGGNVISEDKQTTIFRVTPGPNPKKIVVQRAAAAPAATQAVAQGAANAPAEPTVAKQHRLAKKAKLDLLVRDVEGTLKQAQSTVRRAGGDVTSLNDTNPHDAGSVHAATMEVEVPADRLEDTLDHLGLLGTVETRAIDAEDVDATIVDEEARLRNLRRAETDLRKLMDKGGKVDDILTVQQNLSEVRGQIEQLDAQHRNDVHRVATSTIAISLTEDRPNATSAKPGPTARIDGAWHSGLNALADNLIAFVTTVVWCVAYAPIPLALAGLTYAVARALQKRTAPAP